MEVGLSVALDKVVARTDFVAVGVGGLSVLGDEHPILVQIVSGESA